MKRCEPLAVDPEPVARPSKIPVRPVPPRGGHFGLDRRAHSPRQSAHDSTPSHRVVSSSFSARLQPRRRCGSSILRLRRPRWTSRRIRPTARCRWMFTVRGTRPARPCRRSCSSTSRPARSAAMPSTRPGRRSRRPGISLPSSRTCATRASRRTSMRSSHIWRRMREPRHRPRAHRRLRRLRQRLPGAAALAEPEADGDQGRRHVLRLGAGDRVPARPATPLRARRARSPAGQSRDHRARRRWLRIRTRR